MRKSKVKLSLIDDYIKIFMLNHLFETIHENPFSQELKIEIENQHIKSFNLKSVYENIFQVLKLNNNSFLILKKDLEQNTSLLNKLQQDNFSCLESFLVTTKQDLQNISYSLKEKLNKLNLLNIYKII